MDAFKLVAVIILLLIAVVSLGAGIAALADGSDAGEFAFGVLTKPADTIDMQHGEWSPWDVVTDIAFGSLFPDGNGGNKAWPLITSVFGAVIGVVLAIYLFKLAAKILGG